MASHYVGDELQLMALRTDRCECVDSIGALLTIRIKIETITWNTAAPKFAQIKMYQLLSQLMEAGLVRKADDAGIMPIFDLLTICGKVLSEGSTITNKYSFNYVLAEDYRRYSVPMSVDVTSYLNLLFVDSDMTEFTEVFVPYDVADAAINGDDLLPFVLRPKIMRTLEFALRINYEDFDVYHSLTREDEPKIAIQSTWFLTDAGYEMQFDDSTLQSSRRMDCARSCAATSPARRSATRSRRRTTYG